MDYMMQPAAIKQHEDLLREATAEYEKLKALGQQVVKMVEAYKAGDDGSYKKLRSELEVTHFSYVVKCGFNCRDKYYKIALNRWDRDIVVNDDNDAASVGCVVKTIDIPLE